MYYKTIKFYIYVGCLTATLEGCQLNFYLLTIILTFGYYLKIIKTPLNVLDTNTVGKIDFCIPITII